MGDWLSLSFALLPWVTSWHCKSWKTMTRCDVLFSFGFWWFEGSRFHCIPCLLFPSYLSLSSSHKNWLKKWLRALIGLMPLFAVYNLKHAIWLSNYDSLKRILKEPQNTGYKVIVVKIIKIIFIYFFELFLMNISLAGHTKSCQLKVFSNPQNTIILSLQAAQYTFKI